MHLPTKQHQQVNLVPTLNTERLTLRPVNESDVPAVQKNFEDWDTVRFLNAVVPWPYPRDGAAEWYRNLVVPGQGVSHWSWAVCLQESPQQLIGVIELFREGRPSNRGFWLDRHYRGHRYMEEAANAVNDYAFTTLGFEKLHFDNALGNIASRRIKEKTGATFVCVDKANFVDPAITEMEHWELTKEAWQAHRSRVVSQ